MKRILLSSLAVIMLAFTGCKTTGPVITRPLVAVAVSIAVEQGVAKEPGAVPYLRAATPVVCSAAHGTNIAPAEVIAALESSNATALKTPAAVIIINAALSVYAAFYDQWGGDVKNQAMLSSLLLGVCDGLTQALPPAGNLTVRSSHTTRPMVQ